MAIIDLTLPLDKGPDGTCVINRSEKKVTSLHKSYTAALFDVRISSMAGTYIDFPGHIHETDDGADAGNAPVENFFRLATAVIHLDRQSGSGGISARELADNVSADVHECRALIINGIGKRTYSDVDDRSVFLLKDAADWIVSTRCRLVVSDVYESREIQGIFNILFSAGICTVCRPANLFKITDACVLTSVVVLPLQGVTQCTCRVFAEKK